MAMFYCHDCDTMKDGDWECPVEDPKRENELMCEDCFAQWEEDQCFIGPPVPSPIIHRWVDEFGITNIRFERVI